jgi:hypothetical protein
MKHWFAIRALALGGACVLGACGTNDSDSVGPGGDPPELVAEAALPSKRRTQQKAKSSLGPDVPSIKDRAECEDVAVESCKSYRITLLGDPNNNDDLRKAYKAKFGEACYVSATNAFNCYFETPKKACEQVMFVPGIAGAAAYDKHPLTCKHQGGDIWTLQIGPDSANVTNIYYEDPPLQHPLIQVDSVPTLAVNGPYRNLPEPSKVLPGRDFHCSRVDGVKQKDRILAMNRKKYGKLRSDLAGYTWPCVEDDKPTTCTEKTDLNEPPKKGEPYDPNSAQVDHVASKQDPRTCDWGTNSNKNAAVISAKLNLHFLNRDRDPKSVDLINAIPPYDP